MKRILIIEDEMMLRDLIEDILFLNGYQTSVASNGKEGVELFRQKRADLVICDVIMPEMSGFDVLEELRKNPLNAAVPIILLTGKADRADFRKGMELGADDFIPKPFTEEELIGSVSAQLKKREDIFLLREKNRTNHLKEGLQRERFLLKDIEDKSGGSSASKRFEINDHVLFNVDGQPKLLKISSLKCISALGDYSNVITSEGKFIIRKPMKEWEEILPEKHFIRIHRSTIINLDFVDKIERLLNRAFKVYIKNINKPFIISRRYSSRIREKFS